MISRSLIKIIDIAILPAVVMVGGKVLGLVFAIFVFSLPWSLNEVPSSIFSLRPVFPAEDVVTASTYSDLVMYIILAAFFSFVLVQATHFHETHIKPALLVKLSNHNLLSLVRGSFDLYHSAAVWLIFLWAGSGIIAVNTLLGKTEAWVLIVALIGSAVLTSITLQDVYREIELGKKNLGNQQALG